MECVCGDVVSAANGAVGQESNFRPDYCGSCSQRSCVSVGRLVCFFTLGEAQHSPKNDARRALDRGRGGRCVRFLYVVPLQLNIFKMSCVVAAAAAAAVADLHAWLGVWVLCGCTSASGSGSQPEKGVGYGDPQRHLRRWQDRGVSQAQEPQTGGHGDVHEGYFGAVHSHTRQEAAGSERHRRART